VLHEMYIKKLLVGSLPSDCFTVERNVTSELIEKKNIYLCQKDIEVSASVNKSGIQNMVLGYFNRFYTPIQ